MAHRSRPRAKEDAPATKEKQIGIRVAARMNDQLVAIARRENNAVSAVIRRLLTEALAATSDGEAA